MAVAIQGVCIAPSNPVMTADPDWLRLDTVYNVQRWTVDRGRQNEMSRTSTGTATVELVDQTGSFDPTNIFSPFYGLIEPGAPMGPLVHAAIALENPCNPPGDWGVIFRGFISSISWEPYQTMEWANVTLNLVDGLAVLAAAEMPLDGSFGDDFIDGNIIFGEDLSTAAVQHRINKLLDGAHWPVSQRSIFSGNVKLQRTVYPPRTTVLSAMQDAADAEFPDVSNIYIGGPRNPGKVVFHGRFARFNPGNPAYGIMAWKLGDDAAAELEPGDRVRISPPLVASLDDTLLYTSALAAPQNIADPDIGGQYVTDALAVTQKGLRTWSAENLATAGGAPPAEGAEDRTGNEETKLFADYIRDNYPTPRVRVGQLTVKGRRPDSVDGPPTWAFSTQVDISDQIYLQTTHFGGGGFNDAKFFVEGIHYEVLPGPGVRPVAVGDPIPAHPIVEVTLDVSPASYYDSNPFGS